MKTTEDAAAGGALMGKSADEVHDLLEEMTSNSNEWSNERGMPKKVVGIYEINGMNMLNVKMDFLVKIFGKMGTVNAICNSIFCDNCGGSHMPSECMQVKQAQLFQILTGHNRTTHILTLTIQVGGIIQISNGIIRTTKVLMRNNLIHLDFSQDHNKLRLSHHAKLLLRD